MYQGIVNVDLMDRLFQIRGIIENKVTEEELVIMDKTIELATFLSIQCGGYIWKSDYSEVFDIILENNEVIKNVTTNKELRQFITEEGVIYKSLDVKYFRHQQGMGMFEDCELVGLIV